MNVTQHIERGRAQFPNRTALVFEGQSFTYQDVDEMATRVANGLRGLGVKRGDRVALFLPNTPAFVFAYCGILKMGAIAVSLNVMLKEEEVGFILNDCGAVALITTPDLLVHVPLNLATLGYILVAEGEAAGQMSLAGLMARASSEATAVEMGRDDPAAIVYSSGTTGFPKGVTLSHGNVTSNMAAKKRYCGMRAEDRALLFVPLFHCFGQNAVLNSIFHAGGTVILQRSFDLERVVRDVAGQQVTMLFGVPTTFLLLQQKASPKEMATVRYYFSAAAKMPLELARQWPEKYGLVINEGYGLTESSPFAAYNHLEKYQFGSVGTPIEGVAMKIVSVEDGRDRPPGELGEIVIRGPNVMLGYWNRPEATAESIRDGWLHTGDIGRMDEEGYFYVVDRLKDMVNVAGLKVYPAEVEGVIYRHPAVAEVVAYGVPDAIAGERLETRIVLKPGHQVQEGEILALCRQHMASFKVPAAVEFVEALPKNPAGKILRRVLRERTTDDGRWTTGRGMR